MSTDTLKLSATMRTQMLAFLQQIHEANEKRYVHKTPVADTTALTAIAAPADGETRQVLSTLPTVTVYTFNSGMTSGLPADDATVGNWFITNETVQTPEVDDASLWTAAYDYQLGDIFSFVAPAGAIDSDGNELATGKLYLGNYVDGAGTAIALTSGATMDVAEVAKLAIPAGTGNSSLEAMGVKANVGEITPTETLEEGRLFVVNPGDATNPAGIYQTDGTNIVQILKVPVDRILADINSTSATNTEIAGSFKGKDIAQAIEDRTNLQVVDPGVTVEVSDATTGLFLNRPLEYTVTITASAAPVDVNVPVGTVIDGQATAATPFSLPQGSQLLATKKGSGVVYTLISSDGSYVITQAEVDAIILTTFTL